MTHLYLQFLMAGALAIMVFQFMSLFLFWLRFVIVGWRITKPLAMMANANQTMPEGLSTAELMFTAGTYSICLAVFIFCLIKVDVRALPSSMKAIISLSIAQSLYAMPMYYAGYREQFRQQKFFSSNKVLLGIAAPLMLVLTVALGTILCVPVLAILFGAVAWRLSRAQGMQKMSLVGQIQQGQANIEANAAPLTAPKTLLYSDLVSFVGLAGAYWLFGFRSNWVLFVAPALLLVIANRMFSTLLTHIRKEDVPAELRAVNPFAFAGTLIILFSFYVALLLNKPDQTTGYLLASSAFLIVLWYFCYLSRKETTIEVAKQAYSSKDYDFQVDSSNGILAIFSRLLWFLHPFFFALGLSRAAIPSGALIINAWFGSMKVAVIATLIYTLTSLFIWARNIREPSLSVAGKGRPDYPEYRDNLAASALPYCVLIPALIYAFLHLMNLSPVQFLGMQDNLWLEITVYVVVALILIGVFVQLPYRAGAKAWKSPKLMRLEEQIELIRKQIEERRDNLLKSKSSVIAMKNIADELTLYRARIEVENEIKMKKLSYNIAWPGEIGKDSALYFVLSFIASAITTVIATNLDEITRILLKVPK